MIKIGYIGYCDESCVWFDQEGDFMQPGCRNPQYNKCTADMANDGIGPKELSCYQATEVPIKEHSAVYFAMNGDMWHIPMLEDGTWNPMDMCGPLGEAPIDFKVGHLLAARLLKLPNPYSIVARIHYYPGENVHTLNDTVDPDYCTKPSLFNDGTILPCNYIRKPHDCNMCNQCEEGSNFVHDTLGRS